MTTSTAQAARTAAELREAALEVARLAARRRDGRGLVGTAGDDAARPPADGTGRSSACRK